MDRIDGRVSRRPKTAKHRRSLGKYNFSGQEVTISTGLQPKPQDSKQKGLGRLLHQVRSVSGANPLEGAPNIPVAEFESTPRLTRHNFS
jgi:hypothetical protein